MSRSCIARLCLCLHIYENIGFRLTSRAVSPFITCYIVVHHVLYRLSHVLYSLSSRAVSPFITCCITFYHELYRLSSRAVSPFITSCIAIYHVLCHLSLRDVSTSLKYSASLFRTRFRRFYVWDKIRLKFDCGVLQPSAIDIF